MKKVGREYPVVFSYDDVKKDMDGWVDAKKYLPADYDLVYMRREGKKTISGWTFGTNWEGLRLKDDDNILYWKKQVEKDHG
mgnify:CR=1 FL=1